MSEHPNLDKVLSNFKRIIKEEEIYVSKHSYEIALYYLLEIHKEELPPLETIEDYYYFHKCFRQVDVFDDGRMDAIFYSLIDSTELFWEACEEVFK